MMEALESLERLLNIRRKSSSDEEKSEIEQLAERLVVSLGQGDYGGYTLCLYLVERSLLL